MSITLRLALVSIFVGLVVLTLKYLAYYVTGSIALYSDALESVINVATAIAAFIAIRISSTPTDREHPYGHHKAEYLSAVLEGVLIMLAAFSILREAQIIIESWRRHYNGVRPHASLGYRAPAPEVFMPAFAAWPAAQPRPAPPATLPLAPRPSLN